MFDKSLPNHSRRDPFGRIESADDELFNHFRANRDRQNRKSLGTLSAPVGRDQNNSRVDVAKVETLMELNQAFDLSRTDGATGIFSLGLERAIQGFQGQKGLKSDGLVNPKGETLSALLGDQNVDGDGKGDDKAPPPKPKSKPKPKPDDSESDCDDFRVAVENAKSILQDKVSDYENLKGELGPKKEVLEAKIQVLQEKLDAMLAAKSATDKAVKSIGIVGGALGGGLLGLGVGGPGAGLRGVYGGVKVGDEISGKAIDANEAKIEALESEIKVLQAQIDALVAQLETAQAAVDDAKSFLDSAEEALQACLNSKG